MTDDDQRTMEKYEITCETKTIFRFQGHRYERLADAISYAKKQKANSQSVEPPEST